MTNTIPTKQSYEQALRVVKAYEDRQKQLEYLEKELAWKLQEFMQPKFKIDKKNGEVLFAGFHVEKDVVVVGKSKCDKTDVFEAVIGKLIAVKNALHEDVSDIVKQVETKKMWNTEYIGGIVGATVNNKINSCFI